MKAELVFLILGLLGIILWKTGRMKIPSISTGWMSAIPTRLGGLGKNWMKVLVPLGTILFIYGLVRWFYPEWAPYLAKDWLIAWILVAVLLISATIAYVPWKFVRVALIVPIVAILGLQVLRSVDWEHHFRKSEVREPSPPSPVVAPKATVTLRCSGWMKTTSLPSHPVLVSEGDECPFHFGIAGGVVELAGPLGTRKVRPGEEHLVPQDFVTRTARAVEGNPVMRHTSCDPTRNRTFDGYNCS